MLEAEIAHQRSDDAARQDAPPLIIAGNDEQQLIAVVDHACTINHDQPVAVAVERNAEVGAVAHHFFDQPLWFRGAAVGVDVHAIRLIANRDDVGAKLVQHRRRDVVARAVRAVDDEAQSTQVELGRKRALAKFDVAACRIVDPPRFAKLC